MLHGYRRGVHTVRGGGETDGAKTRYARPPSGTRRVRFRARHRGTQAQVRYPAERGHRGVDSNDRPDRLAHGLDGDEDALVDRRSAEWPEPTATTGLRRAGSRR